MGGSTLNTKPALVKELLDGNTINAVIVRLDKYSYG